MYTRTQTIPLKGCALCMNATICIRMLNTMECSLNNFHSHRHDSDIKQTSCPRESPKGVEETQIHDEMYVNSRASTATNYRYTMLIYCKMMLMCLMHALFMFLTKKADKRTHVLPR